MGVDFLARKAAKKAGKQDRKQVERRVRKKKGPRRLCRGVCFQDPLLKPEDLEEGDEPAAWLSKNEQAEAAPQETTMESRIARELIKKQAETGKQAEGKPNKKEKQDGSRKQPAAEEAPPKRRKLSTSSRLGQEAAERPLPGPEHGGGAAPTAQGAAPLLAAFPDLIQRFMVSKGFQEPTPVQEQAWPALLRGDNVRAVAEPGAGKTLAFLLPCAVRLAAQAPRRGQPLALVLEPTRELAQQVAAVWKDLTRLTGLECGVIHGGVPKQEHIEVVASKPHVLVATPGRLLDLVQSSPLDLGYVKYLVLDEADRLLSMGFAPQLDRLKRLLRLDRPREGATRPQVALFTATFPAEVAALADVWLENTEQAAGEQTANDDDARPAPHQTPAVCVIESEGPSARSISQTVTQVVQVCAEHRKPAKLLRHLAALERLAVERGERNRPRVLVFANRIKTVKFLQRLLAQEEAGEGGRARARRVAVLHGARTQEERDAALAEFKSGKAQILVASDVAARGLHIQNLPYVVNYDFPTSLDQYIHRVGRTGRLAAHGHAFSFFTRELAPLAGALVALLEAHDAELDPNLVKLAEAFETVKAKLGEAGKLNDVLGQLGLKARKVKKAKAAPEDASPATQGDAGEPATASSPAPPAAAPAPRPAYIEAATFEGAKPGYYFGRYCGKVGYHFDRVAAKTAAEDDVPPSGTGKGRKKALPGRLRRKIMNSKLAA